MKLIASTYIKKNEADCIYSDPSTGQEKKKNQTKMFV